jgi:hypothetical protein
MFFVEEYGTRQGEIEAALNVLSACPRIGLLDKAAHDGPDSGGKSDLSGGEPGSPSTGGETEVTLAFLSAGWPCSGPALASLRFSYTIQTRRRF